MKFKSGFGAGGFNPPNNVRLDPTLKDPNYTGEYYHALKSKDDPREIGRFRGPDVIAHELLGHGYDKFYPQEAMSGCKKMKIKLK